MAPKGTQINRQNDRGIVLQQLFKSNNGLYVITDWIVVFN